MIREIQKALIWAAVFGFVGVSYLLVLHIGYAHGFDAGYQAQTEQNQN